MIKININRPLIPLKIILFCFFGASSSLMSYMTIHMRQLGISVEETAIIYTILPVTQLLGSPIAGFVADKLGKYKPVLLMSLILCIITSTAIMFIPSSGDPSASDDQKLLQNGNHALTFWVYLVLRVVFNVFSSICFALLDATSIVLAENFKSSYGRERVFAIIAQGLFAPIIGFLIDYVNTGRDEFSISYSPAFYFFNGLVLLTVMTLLVMNIDIAPPPPNLWLNLKVILKSVNIWVFLIVVFILGTCWGFVESFLFWYLLDLKAPKYLLGLTLTTGAIVGLPFLYTSEWFVKKAGHVNLLILAFFVYLLRFVGYSIIDNPWWCIPFEALEAFTYHLMWVAAATYSAKLAPHGLMATVQGVVGGLHYGVGRGSGSMIGGTLMAVFSARIAFRSIGIFSGITGVVYAIIFYAFLRKKEQTIDTIKNHIPESGDMLEKNGFLLNQNGTKDVSDHETKEMSLKNERSERSERSGSISSEKFNDSSYPLSYQL